MLTIYVVIAVWFAVPTMAECDHKKIGWGIKRLRSVALCAAWPLTITVVAYTAILSE